MLSRLEQHLNERGRSLDALLSNCRIRGGEAAAGEFGLDKEEKGNKRHFTSLADYGVRVMTPAEFVAWLTGGDVGIMSP